MNETTAGGKVSGGAFPFLILLFIGSGCSALIYELVWFQLLTQVIGASSISLGILLATFMGGMCLGSLLLPGLVSKSHHPLTVYAWLEIGIGLFGLLLLYAMPLLRGLYFVSSGTGLLDLILRGIFAGICLLPPTLLMGATLPAIARWVRSTPSGVSWLGFFYGGNIAGAVLGTALAGFYLLRIYDIVVATYVAVAINIAVATGALAIRQYATYRRDQTRDVFLVAGSAWPVYVTTVLSGATALAAEVLWTRHLSLFIGATVYGFALILAVFLAGLGMGSAAGAMLARSLRSPKLALGCCQLLLCIMMAWAGYSVTQTLPYWEVYVSGSSPWARLGVDLLRTTLAMLPAALLWGASFPLALAAASSDGQDTGRLVGGLYAANTFGAIIGSLSVGFFLVPWVGSQITLQILIVLSAGSALLMFLNFAEAPQMRLQTSVTALSVLAAGLLMALTVRPIIGEVIAYGRYLPASGIGTSVIYQGEGLTASIAVSERYDGTLTYHNSGKVQASSFPQDMRLQRMLGHLTSLVPAEQENFLVIGLGAGVTAGAVAMNPDVENVIIAEIEPLVPDVISRYFRWQNYNVVDNPKVSIHIDDGRHFLQTTDLRFDGITSDPLDPWVKGAAALYTEEFWNLAKSRLKPGGVVTVFVQLYESTEAAVKSEIATFLEAFPNGAIFANTYLGEGYDLVLVGMRDDDRIDVDRMVERFNKPAYAGVRESLGQVGFQDVTDLLSTFAGQRDDLADWLAGGQLTRDRNLRLQYLAGMGLNLYQQEIIFDRMTAGGIRFPDDLFTGDEELLQTLESKISQRQGRF